MTEKKINISLSAWEKQNPLTTDESALIRSIEEEFNLKKYRRKGALIENTPSPISSTVISLNYSPKYQEKLIKLEMIKSSLLDDISTAEEIKDECHQMVKDLDGILHLKEEIVDKIGRFYSDSSELISKQKLLHLFSVEVNRVFEHTLTKDKVLYYNNLFKKTEEADIESTFIDNVLVAITETVDGELFFKLNERFKGADYQLNTWIKVKDLMVNSLMRKTASAIREIYSCIKESFGEIKEIEKSIIVNLGSTKHKKQFRVDFQKLVYLLCLEPSLLECTGTVTIDGVILIDSIKTGKFAEAYPQLKSMAVSKRIPTIQKLIDSVVPIVPGCKKILCRMTSLRHEGKIDPKIYDDLVEFWFTFKFTTIEKSLRNISHIYNEHAKSKKLHLTEYVQEMVSYAMMISFGEFWDFSSFLYRIEGFESGDKVGVIHLRTNELFQSHMDKIFAIFAGEMMRQVMVETDMEAVYTCHNLLKELSTLPVKPKDVPLNVGESLMLSFDLILTFVSFNSEGVEGLFNDELFCFYYSIYKRFIDEIKRDLHERIIHLSELVVDQLFKNFQPKEFLQSHPLEIPSMSETSKYQEFVSAGHSELFLRQVRVARYLLKNTKLKVKQMELSQLAFDLVSFSLKSIFECSQHYKDSFDASLFVIKNVLYLYSTLEEEFYEHGGIVTLAQMSYSPSSSTLSSFMTGNFDLASIGKLFLDLLPKMSTYSVDLRDNLSKVVKHILEKNLQLYTYKIAEELIKALDDPSPHPESVKLIYESFPSKIIVNLEEMISKLSAFTDHRTHEIYRDKFFKTLEDTLIEMMHKFKIQAAKKLSVDQYKQLGLENDVNISKIIQDLVEDRLKR